MPGTIRFAPTDMEIGVTVQICTAGMPAASICLTNVAPQRVSVPHVDVKMTPSTIPSSFSSLAMASPKAVAWSTAIALPTVT